MATQQDYAPQQNTGNSAEANKMLAFLLSASQGQGSSGAQADNSEAENLTAQAAGYGMHNVNQMSQPIPAKDYSNQRQPGSGFGSQLESQLVGQLLGSVGHGLNKYIGNKIDTLNAGDELKKQQDYIKAMPPNLSPVQQAVYMQNGPTEDIQKTGNNMFQQMLGNQDSASYLQPKTVMSGVQDQPELQQPMMFNQQTRAFEPIPNTYPIGAKIPYGADTRIQLAQDANVRAVEANQRSEESLAIQKQNFIEQQAQRKWQQSQQLNADFMAHPAVKTHEILDQSFGKIQSTIGEGVEPSAANDMAATYSIMHMLDPTSTVREGEYASMQHAAGIPDQVLNAFKKAFNGEMLMPSQRKEFYDMAQKLYEKSASQAEKQRVIFEGRANRQGLDPEFIVSPIPGYVPPAPAPNQSNQSEQQFLNSQTTVSGNLPDHPKAGDTYELRPGLTLRYTGAAWVDPATGKPPKLTQSGGVPKPTLSPAQARKMLIERGLIKSGATGSW
jgi:hypothetical protein